MDGYIIIETKVDTKGLDKGLKTIEQQMTNKELTVGVIENDKKVRNLNVNWQKVNKNVKLYKKNLSSPITNNITKEIKQVEQQLGKIEKTSSNVIKKASKWALAIFSVRSAYSAIRNAMSILTQYNDGLATKLENIKLVFATALEPIITRIVDLVYNLLGVINSISKAWFGVDLFAKASAMSIDKSAKSAEKMKKSLAGFDEMNVLNDNGTTGAIGGLEGLGDFSDIDTTKYKNFWDEIIQFWEEDYAEFFSSIDGNWSMFFEGLGLTLKGFYDVFKGVFQLIRGVVEVVVGLFQGDFEKIKEAWSLMGEGLYNIIVGILEIILGVFSTVLGAIKGLFLDLVTGIYNTVIVPIGKFFAMLWDGITNGFKIAINFIKNTFMSVVDFFRNIINTIVGLFKTIGSKVADAISSAFKSVINAVLKTIESILNKPINAINSLLDVINAVPGIDLGRLNTIKLPRLAVGGIVNMPSRGVPIGGAIAGESGAEGVIPLTDTQAMEILGATIGKYITINASITNTMNGRVISRELQKINTNNDFAMNR